MIKSAFAMIVGVRTALTHHVRRMSLMRSTFTMITGFRISDGISKTHSGENAFEAVV